MGEKYSDLGRICVAQEKYEEAIALFRKAIDTNQEIVGSDRVVFYLNGNDYRMVTAIDYRRQIVFIKWLGKHRDYDKIDVRTVQYGD